MTKTSDIPRGGVDLRRYAAICLALGRVRGALSDALAGEFDDARAIYDGTAFSRLAEALGCSELELAIDWNDHLTPAEIMRLKGFET